MFNKCHRMNKILIISNITPTFMNFKSYVYMDQCYRNNSKKYLYSCFLKNPPCTYDIIEKN